MDKKTKDKYNCYSLPLMQFLTDHGINFKTMKTNPTSGKNYYIYEKTEPLDRALTQWAAQNPKKDKSAPATSAKPGPVGQSGPNAPAPAKPTTAGNARPAPWSNRKTNPAAGTKPAVAGSARLAPAALARPAQPGNAKPSPASKTRAKPMGNPKNK